MEEEGDNEMKALLKVWLQVLLSLIYAFFLVSKLPKGKFRLFSLIPVFYLFTLLPLSLSTPTTSGLSGFFFTWLANFKLILFGFGLGPLSHDLTKKSFFGFLLVAAFPIKIKRKGNYDFTPHKRKSLGVKFVIYVLFVVSGVYCNVYYKNVNYNILLGVYCGVIYMSLEVVLGFYNKLLGFVLDVDLSQPFNEPYLSTSLQDFWGRRWNLMVSDVLRETIYKPVRAVLEIHIGSGWAQSAATMAAFVVSGLMHELLFYYITRADPTWEVTCFFLLHAVCLVIEMGLKRWLGRKEWALHWALSGPLTIGFVIWTGFWLFMPQLVRNQVDVRSIEELKAVGLFFERRLGISRVTRILEITS